MYAFCQDMPGVDESTVRKVEELTSGSHDGLVAHVSGPVEGGWRIIDVWESEEQLKAFQEQVLYPALAEAGAGPRPASFEFRAVTSVFARV